MPWRRGKAILAHHANGTLQAYIAVNKREAWIDAVDFDKPAAALRQLADEFGLGGATSRAGH